MTPGKRALDLGLALLLAALLALPMLVLIAVMLAVEGRPVFYVSERMQSPTRSFRLIKLRSMRPDGAAPGAGRQRKPGASPHRAAAPPAAACPAGTEGAAAHGAGETAPCPALRRAPVLCRAPAPASPADATQPGPAPATPGASFEGVTGGDKAARMSRLHRALRRSRADEIPQLWNVIRGDMSLVGPRPPLRRYAEAFPALYAQVLRSRPGITGLASLRFHAREEVLLAACRTPEETDSVYRRRCIPRKARLDLIYQRRRSLWLDLQLLAETAATPFRRR